MLLRGLVVEENTLQSVLLMPLCSAPLAFLAVLSRKLLSAEQFAVLIWKFSAPLPPVLRQFLIPAVSVCAAPTQAEWGEDFDDVVHVGYVSKFFTPLCLRRSNNIARTGQLTSGVTVQGLER